jgi:antitoxin HigA-1
VARTIMKPIHPGEVLVREYLAPLGITQHALAVAVGVPPRRINEIVHGKRRISADTALRLSRYFRASERFGSTCRVVTTLRSSGNALPRL